MSIKKYLNKIFSETLIRVNDCRRFEISESSRKCCFWSLLGFVIETLVMTGKSWEDTCFILSINDILILCGLSTELPFFMILALFFSRPESHAITCRAIDHRHPENLEGKKLDEEGEKSDAIVAYLPLNCTQQRMPFPFKYTLPYDSSLIVLKNSRKGKLNSRKIWISVADEEKGMCVQEILDFAWLLFKIWGKFCARITNYWSFKETWEKRWAFCTKDRFDRQQLLHEFDKLINTLMITTKVLQLFHREYMLVNSIVILTMRRTLN